MSRRAAQLRGHGDFVQPFREAVLVLVSHEHARRGRADNLGSSLPTGARHSRSFLPAQPAAPRRNSVAVTQESAFQELEAPQK